MQYVAGHRKFSTDKCCHTALTAQSLEVEYAWWFWPKQNNTIGFESIFNNPINVQMAIDRTGLKKKQQHSSRDTLQE